jgi:hypothetical protein
MGTYVDDHISDDFVVGDEVGVFFFCFEEAVEEILLAFAELGVLHALHVALDGGAGGDGEVVEFVE